MIDPAEQPVYPFEFRSDRGPGRARASLPAMVRRMSAIARRNCLTLLDEGFVVEQGSHDELLRLGGHYARLWRRQRGGFVAPGGVPIEAESDPPDEPLPEDMRATGLSF